MQKICSDCGQKFDVLNEDIELYEKVSPVFNRKRYLIPVPEICPYCRFILKGAFRNEHTYYRTKSSFSGKSLISVYARSVSGVRNQQVCFCASKNSFYAPDRDCKVFSYDEWWSEKWNPLDYGRDFDFNRGFFEQFAELFLEVPRINLIQDGTSENCEYTNFGAENKNCYLTLGLRCEEVYYSIDAMMSKNCVDCLHIVSSEKLYECVSCQQCYNCAYLNRCNQCLDSYFLESCISCKNCIGCKNLRHKQFYIFNKPYSEAEYFEVFGRYGFDTHEGVEKFRRKFEEFKLGLPCLYAMHKLSENSTGEFLDGAKNCHLCYIVLMGAENCRNSFVIGRNCKDIIDSNGCEGELNCSADGGLGSRKILFSHFIRGCSEISYSMFCYNSQNLFGCTGLNRKQYCIFNKQYTKEEYEDLVSRIVEHMQGLSKDGSSSEWGVYFPKKMSAFGYNESFAYDMDPLSKDEALKRGFNWSDYKQEVDAGDSSGGGGGDNYVICEVTGKPFKMIKQEIEFYKRHRIPFPKRHPDVRIEQRYRIRNPNKFWERKCMKCGEDIVTTYDPVRSDIVYCEKCYLLELY